jgi:hypothetical protein
VVTADLGRIEEDAQQAGQADHREGEHLNAHGTQSSHRITSKLPKSIGIRGN